MNTTREVSASKKVRSQYLPKSDEGDDVCAPDLGPLKQYGNST